MIPTIFNFSPLNLTILKKRRRTQEIKNCQFYFLTLLYIKTVEKEVFSIGNNGLKYGKDKYFIDIANEKIKFIGDEIQTPFLRLKDNQISGFHIIENSEEVYTNISFNKGKLSFGLNETQEDFVINSDEIQLNKETVKMNKTVLFGERLKYEQTTGGYNLYVL